MLDVRVLREAPRGLVESARWYKLEGDLRLARDFGAKYRTQLLRARQVPQSGQMVTDLLPRDVDFEVRRFFFNPKKSRLSARIAQGFDFTGIFGERANTGCICERGESAVKSKDKRGAANVVTFSG